MTEAKKKWLESQGWKVGNVQEFLELSAPEVAYIELKLSLSENLKKYRQQKRLTQVKLAKLLKSSYSQVVKMENGDTSVSLDHLVRSLLVLGATPQSLAKMVVSTKRQAAT